MNICTEIDWKENTPILSSPKDVSAIPFPFSYSSSLASYKQSLKSLFLQEFLMIMISFDKSTLDVTS